MRVPGLKRRPSLSRIISQKALLKNMKTKQVATILMSLLLALLLYCPGAQADQRSYHDDNNRAVQMLNQGKHKDAIELLKQLSEKLPQNEVIRKNLQNAYLSAGIALSQKKDYQALASLMLEAQEFDGKNRLFRVMSGLALFRLNKYDEAEVNLQIARSMGEPDAQVLFMLGKIFYATDRMHDAFEVLGSARMLDSGNKAIEVMYKKVQRELAVEQDMKKEYGRHFTITFEGNANDLLGSDVLNALEDIYSHLGSLMDYYPEQQTPVILYSRKQFKDITHSPDWSGGLYDGKIRLPIGGIETVGKRVKQLLTHEYMHVILRDIAGANIPCWLNEGLAQLSEYEQEDRKMVLFEKARRHNKLLKLAALEGSFKNYSGMHAMLAYEQSYSFVRFLRDEYDWYRLQKLVFALGDGLTISEAIDRAFGEFGVNYKSLEKRWLESF